jgi:hypothetical protein
MSESDPVKIVAQSNEWSYYCGTFSTPRNSYITAVTAGRRLVSANAAQVLEALAVPLDQLAQIFVAREFYRQKHESTQTNPAPNSYQDLGLCDIDNDPAWRQLAIMTGKIIRLVHAPILPDNNDEPETAKAIYYPDGQIQRLTKPRQDILDRLIKQLRQNFAEKASADHA